MCKGDVGVQKGCRRPPTFAVMPFMPARIGTRYFPAVGALHLLYLCTFSVFMYKKYSEPSAGK